MLMSMSLQLWCYWTVMEKVRSLLSFLRGSERKSALSSSSRLKCSLGWTSLRLRLKNW